MTTFQVGDLKFGALGDRLLIEEDEFKSGYECSSCGGDGTVACSNCSGRGFNLKADGVRIKCSLCDKGHVVCPSCQGKGGLLVAPETAQRRPTTGIVVSAGEQCRTLKVGDGVMYSNFAGYVVDLARAGHKVSIRILHETEVLCTIEGHLELKNLRGKTEIATFQS